MMKSITFSWTKFIWGLLLCYFTLFILQHSKLTSRVDYLQYQASLGNWYCKPHYNTLFKTNCSGSWSKWDIGSQPTFFEKEKLFLVGAMKDFRTLFLMGFLFDYGALEFDLSYKSNPQSVNRSNYVPDSNIVYLIKNHGIDQFYFLFWRVFTFSPILLGGIFISYNYYVAFNFKKILKKVGVEQTADAVRSSRRAVFTGSTIFSLPIALAIVLYKYFVFNYIWAQHLM